jgi:hypothetical protein
MKLKAVTRSRKRAPGREAKTQIFKRSIELIILLFDFAITETFVTRFQFRVFTVAS